MAATNTPAAKPPLAVKPPFVTEEGKEFSDLEKLLTDLGQQSGGYYLLGANNCWHGGIHITNEKFAHHKKKYPVRCMMDGTVVAYRLNKHYPTQKWQAKSTLPATDLKFSNGFCLIKHEYESPVNPLTFYSFYMHLADYNTYAAESENTEKTIAITKSTNARDTANIQRVIGTLKSGSTIRLNTQQVPKKETIQGRHYDYHQGTVASKAAGSDNNIAVGASVYLYSGCFPAGTFITTNPPVLPGYWKSRVIGKSKERMKVYRTEQACKKRTTPHDALLNEQQTVTFDAAQVKSARINGKTLKIALCKIDNAATFAHNTRLNEGWMIVDESQVSWEKIEPTEFDRIVKCDFSVKAGDPIGFMGIWESPADPIGAGTTKTKYQMHVELFTTDDKAALDKFLNNDARLTTGKKYLKVPKGSKLYSSDGHGGFVNPHELLNTARDYVFEESTCTQVKDTAGTVFYNIKGIRTGEAATGPVDFAHVKIEDGVKLVTQYDWKELGFTTLEENNNDADGYIDPEKIPSPLFKDIFKRVDGINNRNGQGDGTLTGQEIKDALQQDKDLRNDLYKIIAGHPSEWHSTTQNNMKRLFEEFKAKNTEEEYKNAIQFEIDRFLKCEFVSQIEGLTQKLWHFHPLLLTFYMKNVEYWPLGKTSESFESGGRGPGIISSGIGDHGGASYGIYQLSSRMGKLQEYINYSKFKSKFEGYELCSEQFNLMWKEIANEHTSEFREDQHNFIKMTTYKSQINILKENGIEIRHNRAAIHDMVWSTSVQMGQNTKLIVRALNGYDINQLDDIDIVTLVQNYKIDNVEILFRSSPSQWRGLRIRAVTEKERLLDLAKKDYVIDIK